MMDQVTAPSKGNALRASWGAAVSSALGDLLPMGAANGLVRGGATGCGFQPLPQNLRTVETFDFDGPFALYSELGDDGSVSAWKLRNCIWNVGGITHEAEDGVKVEEEIDSESEGGYVYVSFAYVNTDSVTAHFATDLDALHKAQVRYDKYCVPLYRFKFTKSETATDGTTDDGGESTESKPTLEIIDLRRAPQVQSFESDLEFSTSTEASTT